MAIDLINSANQQDFAIQGQKDAQQQDKTAVKIVEDSKSSAQQADSQQEGGSSGGTAQDHGFGDGSSPETFTSSDPDRGQNLDIEA